MQFKNLRTSTFALISDYNIVSFLKMTNFPCGRHESTHKTLIRLVNLDKNMYMKPGVLMQKKKFATL